MILSCDSGSLPFKGNYSRFLKGAANFIFDPNESSAKYFEKFIIESFLDKIDSKINVPNYPQFRDMNEMFLSMIEGIKKIDSEFLETKKLSLKENNCKIPEVSVIEQNSKIIYENSGNFFQLRVCITGPYTLSSFFPYKDEETFVRLGNIISEIIDFNLFNNKYGKTSLVSIDEPIFGFLDDPLIDFGSGGRENLLKSWERIFNKIKSKNSQTMIHLHSTTNPLFWDIESLSVIDSHVDDPLLSLKKTKELLELKDKFLKASVAINDFDILIKKKILSDSDGELSELYINEKIADIWTGIKKGNLDASKFLETKEVMKNRLSNIMNRFGLNRILYAGPECGLKGFPSYENAFECLKRVSSMVRNFGK